jgi:hypothetical protein
LITIEVPLRTGRGLNERVHWTTRAKHTKHERGAVIWAFVQHRLNGGSLPIGPYAVHLVRVFVPPMRFLDDDNWVGAAKGIRDQVAAELHVNDGDRAAVRFTYDQEPGPKAIVRVEIRTREADRGAA